MPRIRVSYKRQPEHYQFFNVVEFSTFGVETAQVWRRRIGWLSSFRAVMQPLAAAAAAAAAATAAD